jgi:ribosome biogenesis protein Tsr3
MTPPSPLRLDLSITLVECGWKEIESILGELRRRTR